MPPPFLSGGVLKDSIKLYTIKYAYIDYLMARMIEKYGDEVVEEIEAERAAKQAAMGKITYSRRAQEKVRGTRNQYRRICHGSEWFFVRLAPIIFIGAIAGAVLTREKQ